jgi:MYXO-CTERM domain-containing protein
MQRFFQSLSACVGVVCSGLLVLVLLVLEPVRLEAESAPPPLPDADFDAPDPDEVDADIDADDTPPLPPDAAIDAVPEGPHDDSGPPPEPDDMEGCSCHVGQGGSSGRRAPAGAALLGVALVAAAAFARRRKS